MVINDKLKGFGRTLATGGLVLALMGGCGDESNRCKTNADCGINMDCTSEGVCTNYTCEDAASNYAACGFGMNYLCTVDSNPECTLANALNIIKERCINNDCIREGHEGAGMPGAECFIDCYGSNPTTECLNRCKPLTEEAESRRYNSFLEQCVDESDSDFTQSYIDCQATLCVQDQYCRDHFNY